MVYYAHTIEVYKQTGYEGIANQYQEQLSKLDSKLRM